MQKHLDSEPLPCLDTTKSKLSKFQTEARNETYKKGLYVAFEETQQDSGHKESQSSADLETFISSGGGCKQAVDVSS